MRNQATDSALTQARLDVRVDPNFKKLLERAAQLKGMTVTSYVVSVLSVAAQADIERETLTVLSNMDRDIFLQLLDSAEQPNQALKTAAKRYGELIAQAKD